MSIKGVGIFKAPFHGGVDIVFGLVATVWVGLYRKNRPPFDTGLSVLGKLLDPSGTHFLDPTALTRQILGPNLGARQMNAIVQRIHLGAV